MIDYSNLARSSSLKELQQDEDGEEDLIGIDFVVVQVIGGGGGGRAPLLLYLAAGSIHVKGRGPLRNTKRDGALGGQDCSGVWNSRHEALLSAR